MAAKSKDSSSTEIENVEKVLKDLNAAASRIENKLSIKQTALRGFITGVFQFLGATIGIAVLFFILQQIFAGIEKIPVINIITEAELVKDFREDTLEN